MDKIIIEYFNEVYPEQLRKIKNPPSRLYAIGNVELLKEFGIAVVGSRKNTQYGERMCKTFVRDLVNYNINIISGLAEGIDSIAHITCLKNSGKTIAVLPSGIGNIYPAKHKELANEIIMNGGLILSEYEENIKADSEKFLERNRIVAGLAKGTLVIEGGIRSGTSVTARYTMEDENPVFCIPSSIENSKGITPNNLIKKGGHLVTEIEDILTCFPDTKFVSRIKKKVDICIEVPENLRDIYKVLDCTPKDSDEIARVLKKPISEVNYKLMLLQLEDKIVELPGKRYVRKTESLRRRYE